MGRPRFKTLHEQIRLSTSSPNRIEVEPRGPRERDIDNPDLNFSSSDLSRKVSLFMIKYKAVPLLSSNIRDTN
jgi:hypothetical protein